MPIAQHPNEPLPGVLEAVATAAHERVSAEVRDDDAARQEAEGAFLQAATAAIAARTPMSELAHAERVGHQRARAEHGKELARAVARTARVARESQAAYEQAIRRAGRLGLPHREIAAAAEVSHTTIRGLLARAENEHVEAAPAESSQPLADLDQAAPSEPFAA